MFRCGVNEEEEQWPGEAGEPSRRQQRHRHETEMPDEAEQEERQQTVQQGTKCADQFSVTAKQLPDEQRGEQIENVETMRISPAPGRMRGADERDDEQYLAEVGRDVCHAAGFTPVELGSTRQGYSSFAQALKRSRAM